MKVLSYLEFSSILWEFDDLNKYMMSCGLWDKDYAEYRIKKGFYPYESLLTIATDMYKEFCSHPFRPEMIMELFEGWNKPKGFYTNNINNVFFYNRNYMINNKITHNDDYLLYPRTLDDFITDCQRAGIELEWRLKE